MREVSGVRFVGPQEAEQRNQNVEAGKCSRCLLHVCWAQSKVQLLTPYGRPQTTMRSVVQFGSTHLGNVRLQPSPNLRQVLAIAGPSDVVIVSYAQHFQQAKRKRILHRDSSGNHILIMSTLYMALL